MFEHYKQALTIFVRFYTRCVHYIYSANKVYVSEFSFISLFVPFYIIFRRLYHIITDNADKTVDYLVQGHLVKKSTNVPKLGQT